MPQRVLLAHAFALPIGLFALLFSQASCSSRAQGTLPQLTVLQSTRSFRLNTNLPRLEDAAVGSNGNLYFLMSEKGQHFEVIRVDDSGNTIQSVVVPPVNSAKLVAPEIQGVERPQIPPSEGWVAQVQSLAATNTDIFVAPTGGKRQEGAPVLRFDTNGVLRQRYRCVLPTFGQDPSQHMSYMFAGKLLASQTSLFWISQSEHKVAEYILPPN